VPWFDLLFSHLTGYGMVTIYNLLKCSFILVNIMMFIVYMLSTVTLLMVILLYYVAVLSTGHSTCNLNLVGLISAFLCHAAT